MNRRNFQAFLNTDCLFSIVLLSSGIFPLNYVVIGENMENWSAEGRTRTGTLDNQRGILSPLRPFKEE